MLKKNLKIEALTWANHQDKLLLLYEQNTSEERIGQYIKKWLQWLRSGVEIDVKKCLKQVPLKIKIYKSGIIKL